MFSLFICILLSELIEIYGFPWVGLTPEDPAHGSP